MAEASQATPKFSVDSFVISFIYRGIASPKKAELRNCIIVYTGLLGRPLGYALRVFVGVLWTRLTSCAF